MESFCRPSSVNTITLNLNPKCKNYHNSKKYFLLLCNFICFNSRNTLNLCSLYFILAHGTQGYYPVFMDLLLLKTEM